MPVANGGSSVAVRIRTSRAVPDCPAGMISAVDAVVSPICREPPSTWPAVSTVEDAAASRGLQDIWSTTVPDRLAPVPSNASACWPLLGLVRVCGTHTRGT